MSIFDKLSSLDADQWQVVQAWIESHPNCSMQQLQSYLETI